MAPVTCAPEAVLVCAPAANVVALTPRTLEQTIFPSEGMDVCLALFGVEELLHMRARRMAENFLVSPVLLRWVRDSHMFKAFFCSYKPR